MKIISSMKISLVIANVFITHKMHCLQLTTGSASIKNVLNLKANFSSDI